MAPRVDSPIVPSAAIAKSWLGVGSNTKTAMASPSPTESSQSPSTTPKAPTSPLGRALAAGFGAGFKLPPLPLPSRVSSKGAEETAEDGNVVVRDNSNGTTSTASSHDPLEPHDSTASNMASLALAPVASGDEEDEVSAVTSQGHTELSSPARSVVAAVTSTAKRAGLLGGGKDARVDGQDALTESTSKVHGYNNGGHEYFSKGDYHHALQFYTRALRWAHKAERAVDAAGGVVNEEGPSEAETEAALTISPSPSAEGSSAAAAVVATTAGQVASGITSGLQLARGKANKLMNRLPLKRHSTCPAGSNGTLSASLSSTGSIRDGHVTAATRASTFLLVPLTLLNVAQCHLARYEMDAATQSYSAAIVRMTSAPLNLPTTHPDVSQIELKIEEADRIRQTLRTTLNLHTFGESAEVNGRYQDAMNTYLTALSMVVETTGTRVHPLVASTLRHLGSVQWKCGHHNDALQSLSECVTIYTHCFGDFSPDEHGKEKDKEVEDTTSAPAKGRLDDTAEALSCLGMVHQARGEFEESLGYYSEAARVRRKIHGDDHPDVARLLVRIASLYDEFGLSRDKAFDLLAEALDIQRRALQLQQHAPNTEGDAVAGTGTSSSLLPLDVAYTLNMIGSLYEKSGTYMAAMSSYSEALAIYRTGFGNAADTHVDVASTLCNLGHVYKFVGRYDEALDVYVRALYIYKTTLGEAHRNVATALHNVASIHTLRGEYDVSLEMLQQVHALQVACFRTEDHPDVACTIDSIGEIYERRGDIASQHHQQSAIAAAAVEEENPSTNGSSLFFGTRSNNSNNAAAVEAQQYAAEAQKQYRAASQQYKSALRVRRSVFGNSQQSYFVALSLHKLALFCYNKERNPGEAKRRFDQALKIYRQSLRMEVSDPEVAEVMQFLHRIKTERQGFRKFMKQDSGSTDDEGDEKAIDAFQRDGAASPSFTTPTAAAMATSLTLEQQMAWISASSPPGSSNTADSRRHEFYPEYVDVEGDVGLEDDESDNDEDDAQWKMQQQHLQFQSSQMHDYYASAVSSNGSNSHEVPPYEGDFC